MKRPILVVLASTYILLTTFVLVGFAWFSLDSLHQDISSLWRTQVENAWQYQHDHLANPDINPLDSTQFKDIKRFRESMGVRVTLIDLDGRVVFDTDTLASKMMNHSDRPEFKAVLDGGKGEAMRYSGSVGKSMLYRAGVIENPHFKGVLRVAMAIQGFDSIMARLTKQWIFEAIIALIVATILALVVSYRVANPIKLLQKGAERFSHGLLDQPLPGSSFVEIDSLSKSMNHMAKALDAQIRDMAMQKSEVASMLASLAEGVVAVNQDGKVFRYNQAFLDLFAFRSHDVQGKRLETIVRNSGIHELLKETAQGNSDILRDISLLRGEVELRLQVRGARLKDMQGVLVVFNDVSRVRKLEEMRRDFVANVSHELKTPITSIKGYVETLLGMDFGDAQATKFLDTVQRHADRLNAIIDDLLALSRLEQDGEQMAPEFDKIDVADLVDAALMDVGPIAKDRSIDLKFNIEPDLKIMGNPGLLEQALVNLLSNACKYSDPNRTVWLKAESKQNLVCLSVEDQGFGIERRHLPRIFERFYRVDKARSREQGGTGLGLAITKHIVLMHHGRIEVESEVGKGSKFFVFLPIAPAIHQT